MSIRLEASLAGEGAPLEHHWNVCVGAGRAAEGLRAGWLEHLDLAARECGFGYLRFHGLFHDDMFVHRRVEGRDEFNWQYVDDLFDRMLDLGVRPFVELGFMPQDLASNDGTVFRWKAHSCPPNDYDAWGRLVAAFVNHCVDRYGLDEVRTWYFEVWNEPNLPPFWHGTKDQYFELYRVSVQAIKAIDEHLRVGGPATSNFVPDERFDGQTEDASRQVTWQVDDLDALQWRGVWIESFLEFCAANDLPVDFVSTHPYPTDFALDGHGHNRGRSRHADSTADDMRWLRDAVDASDFPDAEIHLTEWSCSPTSRDHTHDYPQAATFAVQANLRATGLAESLSWWVFTDVFEEGGGGFEIFHGGFGLINFQGIPKPTFHAYRMLSALGDEELARGPEWIATRDSVTGTIACMAWHYPPEVATAPPMCRQRSEAEDTLRLGTPRPLRIELTDLAPGAAVLVETLDDSHGWAVKAWQEMGCPPSPTREQTELLRQAAWATRREYRAAAADGTFRYETQLAPWAILQVRSL